MSRPWRKPACPTTKHCNGTASWSPSARPCPRPPHPGAVRGADDGGRGVPGQGARRIQILVRRNFQSRAARAEQVVSGPQTRRQVLHAVKRAGWKREIPVRHQRGRPEGLRRERVPEVGVPKSQAQGQATKGPPLLRVNPQVPRRRSMDLIRRGGLCELDGRAVEEDVTVTVVIDVA